MGKLGTIIGMAAVALTLAACSNGEILTAPEAARFDGGGYGSGGKNLIPSGGGTYGSGGRMADGGGFGSGGETQVAGGENSTGTCDERGGGWVGPGGRIEDPCEVTLPAQQAR